MEGRTEGQCQCYAHVFTESECPVSRPLPPEAEPSPRRTSQLRNLIAGDATNPRVQQKQASIGPTLQNHGEACAACKQQVPATLATRAGGVTDSRFSKVRVFGFGVSGSTLSGYRMLSCSCRRMLNGGRLDACCATRMSLPSQSAALDTLRETGHRHRPKLCRSTAIGEAGNGHWKSNPTLKRAALWKTTEQRVPS